MLINHPSWEHKRWKQKELETRDQCHLVMDGQGFPHDIFSTTLGPPKYPKIKLEVKKNIVHGSTSLKILLFLNAY